MSDPVTLVFPAEAEPEDFLALVTELGGQVWPTGTESACLRRGSAWVWVDTSVPLPSGDDLAWCARLLGAPPHFRIVLDVSRRAEAEWIALELIEAAAERWPLVLSDFAGDYLTLDELHRRVETRAWKFFLPEDRLAPGSACRDVRDKSQADRVSLLFSSRVDPGQFRRLVRSLGGELHPDDSGDVRLVRGDATVWIRTPPASPRPASGLHGVGRATVLPHAVNPPPCDEVLLYVTRRQGSELLAGELILAAAERWEFIIDGLADLMTVDQLHVRLASGVEGLFGPRDQDHQ